MSSPRRRIESDVMKLMMTDHEVTLVEDSMLEFYVRLHGPRDSPYEGGEWKVHCQIPDGYPYKSPSIGFVNKIFHPNIDEESGSVCLDVINQTWSPMYELLNVFETFLPQLLQYPNPADPLNGEAAALLMNTPDDYADRVRQYVTRYATREALEEAEGKGAADEDSDSEMSEDDDLDDDDVAAHGLEL
eukprot:CAMPEP_0182918312 /NCGR_PEP_ID=MMETSP0105_2-20130417/2013_1 /TAXON_ID=81532 ORGANISM="Acanthoeca-like sp., Strain 10tr" /NCGR_SAMPLE_ID=MMETSP0105_2 /ASSEMBLY_ACC=CAM_ASM_000205 /LENGTH=187 /DNA_ID=CAMNT_0025055383 /DNA_START=259 /DNA_END=822 /DNA_ORIENTATION=+